MQAGGKGNLAPLPHQSLAAYGPKPPCVSVHYFHNITELSCGTCLTCLQPIVVRKLCVWHCMRTTKYCCDVRCSS